MCDENWNYDGLDDDGVSDERSVIRHELAELLESRDIITDPYNSWRAENCSNLTDGVPCDNCTKCLEEQVARVLEDSAEDDELARIETDIGVCHTKIDCLTTMLDERGAYDPDEDDITDIDDDWCDY